MSLYLRLVIGPVVVCDIDLFSAAQRGPSTNEPPPQLAGGTGMLNEPYVDPDRPTCFGFGNR